jgi:hypothetical protein
MKAIEQAQGLLSRPQCNKCFTEEDTLTFRLTTGNSGVVMSWCPVCAREIIDELSSVFPGSEELPLFVKAMQKL